jgi:hypothetical protein
MLMLVVAEAGSTDLHGYDSIRKVAPHPQHLRMLHHSTATSRKPCGMA